MKRKDKDFLDYKPDVEMDECQRAAHYMHWCAQQLPKRFIPFRYIVRMATASPRTPREDSDVVKNFRRNRMARVKKILVREYGCAWDPLPGVGVRATVDDTDTASTALEAKARRITSAFKGYDTIWDIVDVDKIRLPGVRERIQQHQNARKKFLIGCKELAALPNPDGGKKKGDKKNNKK
jgi:hypothetical protein